MNPVQREYLKESLRLQEKIEELEDECANLSKELNFRRSRVKKDNTQNPSDREIESLIKLHNIAKLRDEEIESLIKLHNRVIKNSQVDQAKHVLSTLVDHNVTHPNHKTSRLTDAQEAHLTECLRLLHKAQIESLEDEKNRPADLIKLVLDLENGCDKSSGANEQPVPKSNQFFQAPIKSDDSDKDGSWDDCDTEVSAETQVANSPVHPAHSASAANGN